MTPNRCDDARNQEYVLGQLEPAEARRLESHLRGCPACALRVKEYAEVFPRLGDLPLPPVPPGIAKAVLTRLRPASEARGALGLLIRRPAFAASAGGLVGLAIAVFREPLLLLFGRITGGLVADGATELLAGIRQIMQDLSILTLIINPVLGALLKLEPIIRALGDAIRAVPAQASVTSILVSLATASLLAGLLGQFRREKLGHAKP